MYETKVLSGQYFKIFGGVYNDFRENCKEDYKFEIEPLEYKDFIEYFEKGFLGCIMLLEDGIPTGFLAYSTAGDEAVELFIIHCLGDEDISKKYILLAKAFLQNVATQRTEKIISYPMLGNQAKYKDEMSSLGFSFVNLAVTVFDLRDKEKIKEFLQNRLVPLPIGYKIVPYRDIYYQDLINCINLSFKTSSDVKFDPRFATFEGSMDIANKITTSVYGQFLANASKILLHENNVVGFCLANITAGTIGNIPLVGIIPEHQGRNLSALLLKSTLDEVIKLNQGGLLHLSEVNASVDVSNRSACKMYEKNCFEEAYIYPQAYAPKLKL